MNEAVEILIAKEAIRSLIMTYCQAADRKDYDLMRSLYHGDAIEIHGGFFEGPAMAFINKLPEIQQTMDMLHHNITTLNIEVEGNYGEAEAYVLAVHRVKGADGYFDITIGGRYLDQFAKRRGGWKFLKRTILADWANVHEPSVMSMDHPMVKGALIGSADGDDPSYRYFRLFKRGRN